jgi:A/G-specific adenine glycosylase
MPRKTSPHIPSKGPAPRQQRAGAEGSSRLPSLGQLLLTWYAEHRRTLPWREHPEPYAVWVSEVMLQQTQVDTVLPYFRRWLARFPDLARLAASSEDEVLASWQGLGYYSRARALRATAQRLVNDGKTTLPDNVDELRQLPGIGRYTAGAVASIAFGRDEPVVDGNVTRVLCRVFALAGDTAREPLQSRLWQLARELLVPGRAGDSNQAIMELGALCCRPKAPLCERCPWASHCQARALGTMLEYPSPKRRPPIEQLRCAAALCRRGDAVLLVQLPADAPRWASMWQFPNVDLAPAESSEVGACRAVEQLTGRKGRTAGFVAKLRHSVTRFRIELELHEVRLPRGSKPLAARSAWQPLAALPELAMPAAHRKLARLLTP